jgi:hypothetical protein
MTTKSHIEQAIERQLNSKNEYWDSRAKRLGQVYNKFITSLNEHENSGELIKKEHSDLTGGLSRIKDDVYSILININALVQENGETKLSEALRWDKPYTVTGFKKFIKTLENINSEKDHPEIQEVKTNTLNCTKEMLEFKDRVTNLKPLIVKKKAAVVKKEEDKARKASHSDVLYAKEFLGNVVETIHSDIVKTNKTSTLNLYNQVIRDLIKDDLKIDQTNYRRGDEAKTYQKKYPYSLIIEVADRTPDDMFTIKDKQTLNQQAEIKAEDTYQSLKAFYISRVADKVGIILNQKNNLNEIIVNNIEAQDTVEAYLTFTFKDDSQFELSTKVEWSTLPSDYTKQFMRVPSRFHNAITPDGEKHTDLSEKIVQDLFSNKDEIQKFLSNSENKKNNRPSLK